MAEPWEVAARNRPRPPRHCVVRFGTFDYPGILLEWRPAPAGAGGVCKFEGLVVWASQDHGTGAWSVKTEWKHGDLLHPWPG